MTADRPDQAPKRPLTSSHGSRDPGLDALRGFAILMVIIHHVGLKFPTAVKSTLGSFFVGIGWGGVDLFFAISGFLITRILLDVEGWNGIRGFFVKRFFRIVPLYVVALGVFLAASLLFGQDREVIARLWMNLLFLTAWVIPFVGENGVPYTITWSVSVEETAYLVFGMLALLGRGVLRKGLVWIVIAAVGIRFALVSGGFLPESAYYFAPGRLDAIALGGIAAMMLQRNLMLGRYAVPLLFLATVAMLGVLTVLSRHNSYVAVLGYTGVGIFAAWLVAAISITEGGRDNFVVQLLAKLGLVSYFVYLFHGFIIAAMHMALPVALANRIPVEVLSLLAVLLTYVPAVISWKYFELPMIAVGRRLADGMRSPAAA